MFANRKVWSVIWSSISACSPSVKYQYVPSDKVNAKSWSSLVTTTALCITGSHSFFCLCKGLLQKYVSSWSQMGKGMRRKRTTEMLGRERKTKLADRCLCAQSCSRWPQIDSIKDTMRHAGITSKTREDIWKTSLPLLGFPVFLSLFHPFPF